MIKFVGWTRSVFGTFYNKPIVSVNVISVLDEFIRVSCRENSVNINGYNRKRWNEGKV